jgi:hypothetical protein
VQSFSSSNINLRRSPAIRRSSNSESVTSLHISPAESSTNTVTLIPSNSSHFNLHRTASPDSDLSKALGSEDDFYYTEDTANGQCHGLGPPAADSDASIASFYYNSPVQSLRPVQRHPVMPLHSTATSAFYAGPVRGAGC